MKLRYFATNLPLADTSCLNGENLELWKFKQAERLKKYGKWILTIFDSDNLNIMHLRREADYCVIHKGDIDTFSMLG